MIKVKFYIVILSLTALLVGCKPKANGGDNPDPHSSKTQLDHLVIWEVFYSGNWRSRTVNGKEYGYHDPKPMYIKIFNPTEEPKYLDGLCIAVSRHTNNTLTQTKFDKPEDNFFKTHFAANEILQIPGSGKEHIIKAGATIVIAKMAIDFTKPNQNSEEEGNPLSIDLSKANFEWLTSDQIKEEDCEDNPNVPNLKRGFFLDEDIKFDPTNRTLVLFEVKDNEYFTKLGTKEPTYFKHYSITERHHHGALYDSNTEAPVVPNEWIIDAVNISPLNDYKMRNIGEKIDAGWFGVSQKTLIDAKKKKEDTGKAIRRKWNGKSYEDTNNSSLDFEVVKASLDKAQHNPSANAK
ncbi:DUF4876 domain-containing protein [Porphyromonas levii]|uniref:DUF4876 domain-containing protein n=1 Tax=Porphyromonas levii TaxID=28114 RepID=UPI001B8C38AA|nr:DUF4876 domain-containing protein [Porphyromonas levii]MBR8712453.1 hypothetical protein [Porphyromonas levii]MBR8714375.1 hypothetical protein [Porphyromonas levii]MBR8726916.1 hypothetical protein [Porphyromonas levii]MBR8735292.1 hypothetical protein [Porphyromonas levii]MBR8763999.1 hypothetical protein [Porphyromonas levii]